MGVIVPNPTVTEPDGSPVVKNVKEILVSNGTLTGSGRTATIDTTGSGTVPAGSDGDYQKKNGDALAAAILSDDGSSMVKLDPGASASGTIRVLGGKQLSMESTNNAGSAGWQNFVLGGEGDSIGCLFSLKSGKALTSNQGKFHSSGVGVDAEFGAYTSTDTALPKVLCTQGTNGSVSLRPAGTGAVAVVSDGANDPVLQLTSTTKAVSLKVETNQKLSVQGGTEEFVFDVSSASGGITFPDGTTQSTAASGGGGGFTSKYVFDASIMSTNANFKSMNMYWPFWPTNTYVQNDATTTIDDNNCIFYPWVARKTANLDELYIKVNTANATENLNVVIYTSNDDGYPSTLLGVAEIAVTSTGVKTASSFTANDGSTSATISLTQGDMYWVGYSVEAGSSGTIGLNHTRGFTSTGGYANNTPGAFYLNGGKYNPIGTWNAYASTTPGATSTMAALWPSTWPAIGSVGEFKPTNNTTYGMPIWVGYAF